MKSEIWWISTTGTASGNGYLHSKKKTFDKLFWEIWKKLEYKLPDPTLGKVYLFELFTNEHEIIVKPDKDRIILLGVRDLATLKEEHPQNYAETNGWECVKSYPLLTSIGMVFNEAKTLDPSQHEGFVVCDNQFNRVKIKSPQYVALAHLLTGGDGEYVKQGEAEDSNTDTSTPVKQRKMLQIVRNNESSEFLAYYPHLEEIHNQVSKDYSKLLELTKYIANDIKTKYYSNGEEETSNKEAILNFMLRKIQHDYTSEFISYLGQGSSTDVKALATDMKESKKFAKFIKQTMLTAIYQELFGNKSLEEVYKDVELGTLFELLNFTKSQ